VLKIKKREKNKMMTPAGQAQYMNPDTLNKNPAFTNVIVEIGLVKTLYVGGQNAVNASGNIVGKGDFKAQTEQVQKKHSSNLIRGWCPA
jgi:enamine deaminase RidA (YjgF/YER057c/UK114 family)